MSVPATLDSLEMESLAQVRFHIHLVSLQTLLIKSLHYTDINECELGVDQCATNATCYNTEGRYECSCTTGFTGNGTTCCMWLTKFYS